MNLNSINVNILKKIIRQDIVSYITVERYEVVRNWGLTIINSHINTIELIVILGLIKEDYTLDTLTINVFSPNLLYQLPTSGVNDEWPILFIEENSYMPIYLLRSLLEEKRFLELVEMGVNLSRRSTKLLTINSLEDILIRTFNLNLPINTWTVFSNDLIIYINKLIDSYSYLGYLPVKERMEYRMQYVSDLSFAWEFYLRFFCDKRLEGQEILIPNLNKKFIIRNWSGDFFERLNPFWDDVIGKGSRFKLSNSQKESVYKYWLEWQDK
jgi:hypothetical protein